MTDPARPTPPPSRSLDDLLDHLVEGPDRTRLEQELASDPSAVAEVSLQRRIDDSLRRLFEPEARPMTLPAPPAGRSRRLWYLGLAAAAAVVLSAAGIYTATLLSTPRPDVGGIYVTEVASGFRPQEICTTTEAFAGWVKDRYDEPLYPRGPLDGIRFAGWSYTNAISGYTGVLLAEVDQRPVIVVLDKASREGRRPATPSDPSLRVFRRTVGGLVLYEVTPHANARILPILSDHLGGVP